MVHTWISSISAGQAVQHDPILFTFFLVFSGAALIATLALAARQSMLVAYIVLGMLLGPWGMAQVKDAALIAELSRVGVIFLLFLLGLNLHPQQLWRMLRPTLLVTLGSSLVFFLPALALALIFGFTGAEALVIAAAMIFSSTILGLKLLPTTQLHHQHIGGLIISILLLQDMVAIVILLLLQAGDLPGALWGELARLALLLPAMVGAALLGARYLLLPLLRRYDTIQEYLFLLAIGWCLGFAELASWLGLSAEIGAFIAGVALATNPISTFIAENLKPLRDFFLVLFFFSLGATFNPVMVTALLWPALLLTLVMLMLKPWAFRYLLAATGEGEALAREVGVRLAQVSEFALFIAVLAEQSGVIGERAAYLIKLVTLLSFILSSYWIMLRYPTPIAVSDKLRRD
jgi:Kef-type K+ transport system membrane component KefB